MAVTRIVSPLAPDVSRGLRTGDSVLLSGRVVTARDQVHKYLASGGASPVDLKGLVIYHCGPVAIQENGIWVVKAAGPTTSMREEPYEAKVIRTHRPGAIMGKGGMGEATREALRTEGCAYLHLTGGAASAIARTIVSVDEVLLTQFGQPEAMWVLQVEDLPALVTMDSRGDSLHKKIESNSLKILQQILKTPFS
jgi:tartrate/fumarate subfamily iron-sulfur-dependent hydro-lyase beta chain